VTSEVATANQRQEATKEQCKRLVHGLTHLSIRGSKLCITITGGLPLTPLHEGMRLVVAQHAEIATRLFALWAMVSLAAQSVLGSLPIDTPQVGIVGEIVVRFWE
jgi:hypothetical protein